MKVTSLSLYVLHLYDQGNVYCVGKFIEMSYYSSLLRVIFHYFNFAGWNAWFEYHRDFSRSGGMCGEDLLQFTIEIRSLASN